MFISEPVAPLPCQHAQLGPTWVPYGHPGGPHMGRPHRTQILLSTGSKWVPYGLPLYGHYMGPIWAAHIWALRGSHMGGAYGAHFMVPGMGWGPRPPHYNMLLSHPTVKQFGQESGHKLRANYQILIISAVKKSANSNCILL